MWQLQLYFYQKTPNMDCYDAVFLNDDYVNGSIDTDLYINVVSNDSFSGDLTSGTATISVVYILWSKNWGY